jgi:hypothetical protein
MRRALLVLTVVLCAAQSSEARVRAGRHLNVWAKPACTGIQGLGSIRFVEPGGTIRKSYFHTINEWASPITLGVVPNTLYTIFDQKLYESTNAGCTWSLRTPLPGEELEFGIYPSRERIYARTGLKLVRITGPTVEVFDLPTRMFGMRVNPANSLHLHGLGWNGAFYESRDGGILWESVGAVPEHSLIYSIAFDPANFDHVLVGLSLNRGGGTGMTTRDGGRNWIRTPFPATILAYTIAFSPADPNVAWMIGFDVTTRAVSLYRSNDGGTTFVPRLQSFAWQRFVVPHPRDPNVVATGSSGDIAVVDNDGVTIIEGTFWHDMVWAPSGTIYFTAPDEEWYQ